MISKFQGTLAQRDSMYETVIYAHMKTFRFTGTPALYIECDIRMCHGSCPVRGRIVILKLLNSYHVISTGPAMQLARTGGPGQEEEEECGKHHECRGGGGQS